MGGSEENALKKDKHEKLFLRTLQERMSLAYIRINFFFVENQKCNQIKYNAELIVTWADLISF